MLMEHVSDLLRVDAYIPADGFGLKVVCIALASSVPELGTGVGFWVVVPPDHILPTKPGVQRLDARLA